MLTNKLSYLLALKRFLRAFTNREFTIAQELYVKFINRMINGIIILILYYNLLNKIKIYIFLSKNCTLP